MCLFDTYGKLVNPDILKEGSYYSTFSTYGLSTVTISLSSTKCELTKQNKHPCHMSSIIESSLQLLHWLDMSKTLFNYTFLSYKGARPWRHFKQNDLYEMRWEIRSQRKLIKTAEMRSVLGRCRIPLAEQFSTFWRRQTNVSRRNAFPTWQKYSPAI